MRTMKMHRTVFTMALACLWAASAGAAMVKGTVKSGDRGRAGGGMWDLAAYGYESGFVEAVHRSDFPGDIERQGCGEYIRPGIFSFGEQNAIIYRGREGISSSGRKL